MKKITLLLVLLLGSKLVFPQDSKPKFLDSTGMALLKAKSMLNPKRKNYNPYQAFVIYQQCANLGSALAMNGLGNLYNNGLGTNVNEKEALRWYEKAANAGYPSAWYNLGSMYKAGIGTPQDFAKAYQAFSKGAALNNGACIYGQGYMLYKGFGIPQNYEQAVVLFKKGAEIRNISSWFMLGLCYRNGYGITKNIDSAKYYLSKAASSRDLRAVAELNSLTPENISIAATEPPQPPSKLAEPVNLKTGFKRIYQNISRTTDITGEYQGYMIRFDWSGKHIISQSNLRVNLEQKNNQITGQWEEDGQDVVHVNAKMTDTALVFNKTEQAQTDHYHRDKKLLVKFQKSHLHMVQSQDTIYLSGNLTVYSPKAKEPDKPRLIMLVRTRSEASSTPHSVDSTGVAAKIKEEELDAAALNFLVFPNPFATTSNLKYTLRRPATVSVLITDVQTGRTVYRSQQGPQQPGNYIIPFTLNERPGNYVVTLQYNQKIKSLIVIKN